MSSTAVVQSWRLLRFAAGLPAFLRDSLSLQEADARSRAALASREQSFLDFIRRAVFEARQGPYYRLLSRAGCVFADLESSVRGRGLEATLRQLHSEGVRLTFEEFKGTQPIVRGGERIDAPGDAFDNPLLRAGYLARSGGSTGVARPAWLSLEHLAVQARLHLLAREAQGVRGVPLAIWLPLLPNASGLNAVLRGARAGEMPERWFTPLSAGAVRPRLAGWSTYWLVMLGRLCGAKLPWPRHAGLAQAEEVVGWMSDAIARRGAAVCTCTVSMAVRIAAAAESAGIPLRGGVFFAIGEPATPAKVRRIEASGARCVSFYNFVEAGLIGAACATPGRGDRFHLMRDTMAVIGVEVPVPASTMRVSALCFTTLQDSAPKVLLNVETDDYGRIETGSCDCLLGRIGYDLELSEVRSYRKLTGEGVTLVGSEMTHVLEEVLPKRFGGTPLDYQLVEEEDPSGLTRLTLVADPRLGDLDEEAVISTILDHLSERPAGAELAAAIWRQAESLRVRRASPRWSAAGKLLPLHVLRRADRNAAGPPSTS